MVIKTSVDMKKVSPGHTMNRAKVDRTSHAIKTSVKSQPVGTDSFYQSTPMHHRGAIKGAKIVRT